MTAQVHKDGRSCDETYWYRRPNLAAPRLVRGAGRGPFALVPIPEGTLIDRGWSVEITMEQCLVLDGLQPVGDMYFAHPENDKAGLMSFGLAALCNHADDPNAEIIWRSDSDLGWFGDLISTKAISKDQEITHRYKCPLWFTDRCRETDAQR